MQYPLKGVPRYTNLRSQVKFLPICKSLESYLTIARANAFCHEVIYRLETVIGDKPEYGGNS